MPIRRGTAAPTAAAHRRHFTVLRPLTVGDRHAEPGDVLCLSPDGSLMIACRAQAGGDELAQLVRSGHASPQTPADLDGEEFASVIRLVP